MRNGITKLLYKLKKSQLNDEQLWQCIAETSFIDVDLAVRLLLRILFSKKVDDFEFSGKRIEEALALFA